MLEVGVGAGTDFINWLRGGAQAIGIDLTWNGVQLTRERATLEGMPAVVLQADAEHLPFRDESFDVVYAYGVLHHTPDTTRAIAEAHRVLKRSGVARIMIYHVPSVVGFLLWLRYCAARLRPWRTARWAIAQFLESPGTKAYSVSEAALLFRSFSSVRFTTLLGEGDLLLLQIRRSAKYRHPVYSLAWKLYPRWLVRRAGDRFGLGLLVEAYK